MNQITVVDELSVQISGKTLIITFIKAAVSDQTYKWTLDNITNPPSVLPSDPFSDLISYDSNNDGVQQYFIVPGPIIINTQPGEISVADLIQKNKQHNQNTTYIVIFEPANPIPPSGVVVINWPEAVTVPEDGVQCLVETTEIYTENCIFDYENRSITIINVFENVPGSYNEAISIELIGVTNPISNEVDSQGFNLKTFYEYNIITGLPYG